MTISLHTDAGVANHGALAPGTGFLSKPFTAETLGAKVHEVLSS